MMEEFAVSKRRPEDQPVNADLLPVMNIMFLLIPALLLAMEFASMAQIPIHVPRFANLATSEPAPTPKRDLEFKVSIGSDGFRTRSGAADVGQGTIPLRGDGHDYAALTAAARDLKQQFPAESTVTITAEGDVPMEVLVRTLDALRGDSCKLGGYIHGEQPSDACLFWSPVIESVG
jgi:biopolymer transport protein ExbD